MLKEVITDLEGESKPDVLAYQGAADSFDVWRRNLVLGSAHNNLGYVYWMELGHYRAALKELSSALPYFLASHMEEEIANTSDNMGRVHALLDDRTRAELLVRDGLQLRRGLGREFRIGLSLNSRAVVHLGFGELRLAHRLSEQALGVFERLGIPRGIGLACITLGRSLCHLGASWRNNPHSFEECHRLLDEAVANLERATGIFPKIVDEPVRLIEAYNELGCTHREWAAMLRSEDPKSLLVREEEKQAIRDLYKAVREAEGKNPVLYVDSCEGLAQVYFQRGDFDNTEAWLERAAKAIPSVYKIKRGLGLRDIPVEECIEEFWRQMGKIEMLRGHLVFDRGLEQAMQHYTFAVAYFERYSARTAQSQIACEWLYDNFKRCTRNDLQYVQEQILPSIAAAHALDASCLRVLLEDMLGLALCVAR